MTSTQQLMLDNLKFFRKQKNLTQANVAKQTGMLASTYSRLESGQVSPQLQTLERVCEAIGIKVVDLFLSRNIAETPIAQKLEMLENMSEVNQNVVEIMIDTVLEKDNLEKSQKLKMRNRLAELDKVRTKD